ncbi:14 kDa proline-rich protein DC2.15-like [Cucumis melo var. makuwa]|uniref:14 kDa proline-rich protein DC2.15-like n=1 Tax=Cucumis melo var. makuwa TaxID=1194695 RepID=A0A5D3CKE8_CUCMM|nr:14 kDa proline-rich protein DC2.15-like [Cucumis melo var. makuwa]
MSSCNKPFSLALFYCLCFLFSSLAIAQPIVPAPSPTTGGANCSLRNVVLCATVLNYVNVNIGSNNQAIRPCCDMIRGLVAVEAGMCISSAVDVRVNLGLRPLINLSTEVILNILEGRCN